MTARVNKGEPSKRIWAADELVLADVRKTQRVVRQSRNFASYNAKMPFIPACPILNPAERSGMVTLIRMMKKKNAREIGFATHSTGGPYE